MKKDPEKYTASNSYTIKYEPEKDSPITEKEWDAAKEVNIRDVLLTAFFADGYKS